MKNTELLLNGLEDLRNELFALGFGSCEVNDILKTIILTRISKLY